MQTDDETRHGPPGPSRRRDTTCLIQIVATLSSRSPRYTRRAVIAQRYRILLLIGDQLDDFTDDYRGDIAQRQTVFNAARAHWGHDWIMLANPTYGSFEAAPYKGSTHMAPGDKRAHKIEALKAWDGK